LAPTADPTVFVDPKGNRLSPPAGWACLPPGDATWTRRVKQRGPSWAVIEKRGRKAFSKGLWAPASTIAQVKAELDAERATPDYDKKRAADVARRERAQSAYVVTFEQEVFAYLSFSSEWEPLGKAMAKLVAAHATPVGSGTVARTKRISVAERASAAVIAWMRHQTTAYDDMVIPRVKGERRMVRRMLAQRSKLVIQKHQTNVPHGLAECSLCRAVVSLVQEQRAAGATHGPAAISSSSV
jgi:hypothetical protein